MDEGRVFEPDGACFVAGLDGVEIDFLAFHAQRFGLDVRHPFGVLEREAQGGAEFHGARPLGFVDLDGDLLAFFLLLGFQPGLLPRGLFLDGFPGFFDPSVYGSLLVARQAPLCFAGLLLQAQGFAFGGFAALFAEDAALELGVGEVPEGDEVFFAFGEGDVGGEDGAGRFGLGFQGFELALLGLGYASPARILFIDFNLEVSLGVHGGGLCRGLEIVCSGVFFGCLFSFAPGAVFLPTLEGFDGYDGAVTESGNGANIEQISRGIVFDR